MKLFAKKENRNKKENNVSIEDLNKMFMEYNKELAKRNQEVLDKMNK